MSNSQVQLASSPFPSILQSSRKVYIGVGIITAFALTIIGLTTAQITGKIDMVKFGKTEAGIITYSLIGGSIGTVGFVALGMYCKNKSSQPIEETWTEAIKLGTPDLKTKKK